MRQWILILACLATFHSAAQDLRVGQRVPAVGVGSEGRLMLYNRAFSWQPWNSGQLAGRVQVVIHLAGTLSAKAQNAALTEALQRARLPTDRYQTTLIIDTDDAIPGSAPFVRASLKISKRQSPHTQIIVDSLGAVRRAWQLTRGGSAVLVLDSNGLVRFARQGALSAADIADVMALLHRLNAADIPPP